MRKRGEPLGWREGKILQLYAEGQSYHTICERLGIVHSTVYTVLRRHGAIKLRPKPRWTPEEIARFESLALAGLSDRSIATFLRRPLQSVKNRLVRWRKRRKLTSNIPVDSREVPF